ncbi:TetR/AcrR family transcriptional regulator [Neobacillus sp. D3-1R]|uniref:TetR/AcrR family transcriptional regulator n=1 Tax=Neobacillus sp. D3-1R TaxID=3445778 RepID=UPI003F9F7BF8
MARERKFSIEQLFQETRELVVQHGYDGFSFGPLANRLEVSRGTLYKYYENKEELISDFMIYEMNQFLVDLKEINTHEGFQAQFDFLFNLMFSHSTVHQLLGLAHQLQAHANEKVRTNIEQLEKSHQVMYEQLKSFIQLGREEKLLKPQLPDMLILGMIFQTIAIPNHFGIPKSEWVQSIKEIICHGMFIIK